MYLRNLKSAKACSRFFSALLFLAMMGPFARPLRAQDSPTSKLQWAAVEGARSYEISVRVAGEDQPFFSESVEVNYIEVPLEPGSYEVMIVAFNVFKKAASDGVWTPLQVRVSANIKNVEVIESSLYSGSSAGFLRIKGLGVLPATLVRVESKAGSANSVSVSEKDGILEASLDASLLPSGTYDLVLENPGSKITRANGAIKVLRRTAPELLSVEPGVLSNDRVYPELIFRGAAFEDGARPFLVAADGTVLEPGRILRVSPTELAAIFNLGEKKAGDYEALIINPGGLESRITLTVVDAMAGERLPTPPVVSEPAEEQPDAGAAPSPDPRSSSVFIGWRPALLLSPLWKEAYKNGFGAAEISLNLPMGGAFSRNAILRMLSVEVNLGWAYFPGLTDAVVLTMASANELCVSTRLQVSWQPLDSLPLSLNCGGGFGLAITSVKRDGAAGLLAPLLSQDSSVLAGLSASWRIERVVMDAGIDWQAFFYINVPLHTIRPFIRVGYIF